MKLFRFCFNKAQTVYGCRNLTSQGLRVVTTVPNFKRNDCINPFLQRSISSASNECSQSETETIYPTHLELENVFKYHGTDTSAWIVEENAKAFCAKYEECSNDEKLMSIILLATRYGIQHEQAKDLAHKLTQYQCDNTKQYLAIETSLKLALTPRYFWLFVILGRLEQGIKFLVDLRKDVLNFNDSVEDKNIRIQINHLNTTLQELLFQWFSVGFLQLERVTWESACDVIQKISEYEAIHPVKSWLDIKDRVGPYRRCYIFTHPALPRDPIVVLHTALCDRIVATIEEVEDNKDEEKKKRRFQNHENKAAVTAAVFYSITSTNKGLKGMQMGNYIIKQVVGKIRPEFPNLNKFSSLSPIPGFKQWFLSNVNSNMTSFFSKEEIAMLEDILQTRKVAEDLTTFIVTAKWAHVPEYEAVVKAPLMRLCAYYLYAEKKGIYARNIVENFHLSNGAMIWRINWKANLSLSALVQSFGIMVNYRYYPEKMEDCGKTYVTSGNIVASEEIIRLSEEAEKLKRRNN